MGVRERVGDGYGIIEVAGSLDTRTDESVALLRLLDRSEGAINSDYVLDLSGVAYINSGMLSAIIRFMGNCHGSNHLLILLSPAPAVKTVLCMTGLDVLMPLVDSLEEVPGVLGRPERPRRNETRSVNYERLTQELDDLLASAPEGTRPAEVDSELKKLLDEDAFSTE
ncbi:MAG: STAS domain-containing protein [Planctomycetota bacterium]|jgi:anti-anti-sigma factor